MIPGAVHRSSPFTTEENPGKPQLGERLMKNVQPVIASNGVPYLLMRSVGSHSTTGRESEAIIYVTSYADQPYQWHSGEPLNT
jgi:hypothetical protein